MPSMTFDYTHEDTDAGYYADLNIELPFVPSDLGTQETPGHWAQPEWDEALVTVTEFQAIDPETGEVTLESSDEDTDEGVKQEVGREIVASFMDWAYENDTEARELFDHQLEILDRRHER